ncbi:MAG: hypothetical protein ABI912_07435 [Actinomycetota bacterium]
MQVPEWQTAANEAMDDLTRRYLQFQPRTSDRDLPDNVRRVQRITAFRREEDNYWKRGELVLGTPIGEHIVWQPFPQGSPLIFDAPLRVSDARTPPSPAHRAAAVEIELDTGSGEVHLRLMPDDLKKLLAAIAG